MTTMRQMCEKIAKADFLRDKEGNPLTPEQIFNSSPTGELFQVFVWYDMAKVILGESDVNMLCDSKYMEIGNET